MTSNEELTVDDIIKFTGQYDLDCVKRLKLAGKGLKSVSNVEKCTNIVILSFPHNNVSLNLIDVGIWSSQYFTSAVLDF